jgi:hypothetical protein
MYNYIFGKVSEVTGSYIVLDNNGVGYLINTPNPYAFNEDSEYKIYVYQQVREDELSIFGFKTKEEKDFIQNTLKFEHGGNARVDNTNMVNGLGLDIPVHRGLKPEFYPVQAPTSSTPPIQMHSPHLPIGVVVAQVLPTLATTTDW